MPGYEHNAYYNPKNVGAELVAEFDLSAACYSFDRIILLRKLDDNTYWVGHDSGCSCPTPFEGHYFPNSFDQVRAPHDVEDFTKQYVDEWTNSPRNFYAAVRAAWR